MHIPCHADNEPGAGGGGDDDGAGSAGGGGPGWSGPWDDEDFDEEEADPSPILSVADAWLWRMGCLVVALQVCARPGLRIPCWCGMHRHGHVLLMTMCASWQHTTEANLMKMV